MFSIYFHLKRCIYQLFLEFAYRSLNSSYLRKVFTVYCNRTENIRQFQQKKNIRGQTKNRKALTIGTLAPLLPFNKFLLHRSLSQHSKPHFLTVGDACLNLLQMSSLHTDFMVHSLWKTLRVPIPGTSPSNSCCTQEPVEFEHVVSFPGTQSSQLFSETHW